MAIVTPNVNPTASLSMPLVTPGFPLVAVEKSSPLEHGLGKQESVDLPTKRQNSVHASGHDNDRSL